MNLTDVIWTLHHFRLSTYDLTAISFTHPDVVDHIDGPALSIVLTDEGIVRICEDRPHGFKLNFHRRNGRVFFALEGYLCMKDSYRSDASTPYRIRLGWNGPDEQSAIVPNPTVQRLMELTECPRLTGSVEDEDSGFLSDEESDLLYHDAGLDSSGREV